MDSRSLNTHQQITQVPLKASRRRYGVNFVGPRLPRGSRSELSFDIKKPLPPSVIRGESNVTNVKTLEKGLFCKVDWLTFTTIWSNTVSDKKIHICHPFDGKGDSEYINDVKEHMTYSSNFDAIYDCLNEEFHGDVKLSATKPFDYCQFASNANIIDKQTGELICFMKIGYHVDSKAIVRWIFLITGDQCKYFDFVKLSKQLEISQSVITRIDLAVDDLDGVRSVNLAKSLYDNKRFASRGRNPTENTVGSNAGGWSYYVGKKVNGKELNVYEKGKQLKSVDNPNWVRWEQRIGNKDRVIPYAAMVDTASYFLGSHPVFTEVFPDLQCSTIERIRISTKQKVKDDVGHFFKYASLSYGKGVDTLRRKNVPDSVILDHLARSGTQESVGQPNVDDVANYFLVNAR